jgi:hypothetical protein
LRKLSGRFNQSRTLQRPLSGFAPPFIHGRGYKRSAFEDAWARYLPPESSASVPPE